MIEPQPGFEPKPKVENPVNIFQNTGWNQNCNTIFRLVLANFANICFTKFEFYRNQKIEVKLIYLRTQVETATQVYKNT